MSIIHVTQENYEDLINGEKPVLMDFFATWCGPCKMLSPILEEIAETENDIIIAKCDIDQCMQYAQKLNIMSVPTLVFFKKGQEIQRSVGFRQKSDLINLIEQLKTA